MKIAYPFANFVILIFGIALVGSASHASRQSGTVGFGLALFLTIIFWGFLRVGQGIGYGIARAYAGHTPTAPARPPIPYRQRPPKVSLEASRPELSASKESPWSSRPTLSPRTSPS